MKVLIGSPVYAREWILPYWFEAIEKQNFPLSDIGFVFETAHDDTDTKSVLMDWHWKHPSVWCFDVRDNTQVEHQSHHPSGTRKWNRDRYKDMALLRNSLLGRARVLQPDRYFSLDTDILLENPDTIKKLVEVTDSKADAASPLMYMTPKGTRHPSVMTWIESPGGRARRTVDTYPIGKTFKADVIMAAKMMSPQVYENVNYGYHRQGEDLAWSYNCYLSGFDLYCVSGIYAPHIMSNAMLADHLENGDVRQNSSENGV